MGFIYKGKCIIRKSVKHAPQIITDNLKFLFSPGNYSPTIVNQAGGNPFFNVIAVVYHAEQIIQDLVNKNQLNLINNPTITKKSFIFNGTNQCIRGAHSGINLTNVTLDLWVKKTNNPQVRSVPFYISDDAGRFIFIDFNATENGLQISTENKSINSKSSNILDYNNQYFNLVVIKTSNLISILINNQITSMSLNEGYVGLWNQGTNLVSLGCGIFQNNSQDFFQGEIGQLRIYDKNLSLIEVNSNFVSWKGKFY